MDQLAVGSHQRNYTSGMPCQHGASPLTVRPAVPLFARTRERCSQSIGVLKREVAALRRHFRLGPVQSGQQADNSWHVAGGELPLAASLGVGQIRPGSQ